MAVSEKRRAWRTYWVTLALLLCLPAMGFAFFRIEYNMQKTTRGQVDMTWHYSVSEGLPLPCDGEGRAVLPSLTPTQRRVADSCMPVGVRLTLWVWQAEGHLTEWIEGLTH